MPRVASSTVHICARCLRSQRSRASKDAIHYRVQFYSASTGPPQSPVPIALEDNPIRDHGTDMPRQVEEKGAMTRRLEELTNRTIEESGERSKKAFEDAGFSEELKRQLEERIEMSKFKSDNAAAFAEAELPASAGRGTRDIAAAQPWAGTESLEDATLRMLNDAHKPLQGTGPPKIPTPRGLPVNVDLRRRSTPKKSSGERLANARDRTSIYALSQDPSMTDKEREQMRKQLKERFTAGARPMPTSMQGLAALANERIEDAIARGQFKNIPRGKGKNIERDYTASSPFLDTTEYFMNKIIQKQDIVPPWIEKQQELVQQAARFRGRLRAEWKRHAARVISSKGGSLQAQIKRAAAYAAAEAAINPRAKKVEALNEIDSEGEIARVTVTEIPLPSSEEETSKITVTEELAAPSSAPPTVSTAHPSQSLPTSAAPTGSAPPDPTANTSPAASITEAPPPTAPHPFRDPIWEGNERSYHTLAITSLNNLTRSYNLMAPDLAKKPYFSLDRELRSCFADVAPQIPHAIKERASAPKMKVEIVGHRPGGVLERFGGEKARVWDERKPQYGFKEFWRDLWGEGAKV
ncbi:MAG: hypothetical protein M1830_007914 [Pleopsidium flavum]|nr:MAG: hypothetical protein M1830_007914 [Pleopsidium flavum]